MSKKRDPDGGHRKIPPFLFENGDVVVLVGDAEVGAIDRYRVICRKHRGTRHKNGRVRPYNEYQIQSLVDGRVEERTERGLMRPATEEFITRVARSYGHSTARSFATV